MVSVNRAFTSLLANNYGIPLASSDSVDGLRISLSPGDPPLPVCHDTAYIGCYMDALFNRQFWLGFDLFRFPVNNISVTTSLVHANFTIREPLPALSPFHQILAAGYASFSNYQIYDGIAGTFSF